MCVKIRIIGIGNPLCGDDGVGVAVAERLKSRLLPPGVEVIDGGLGGLSLIDYFEQMQQVILVDAVDFDARPGEIALFHMAGAEYKQLPDLQQLHSGIAPLLALVDRLQLCPRVDLVAVQPLDTTVGKPLSPALRSCLERVETTIHRLIA